MNGPLDVVKLIWNKNELRLITLGVPRPGKRDATRNPPALIYTFLWRPSLKNYVSLAN